MQEWQQFDNYSDEEKGTLSADIEQLAKNTKDTLISSLDQNNTGSQQLIANITQALSSRDSTEIKRVLQEFSLAAGTGGDATAIAQRVLSAQQQTAMIQQQNKEIHEIVANIKDEDLTKIGELLNGPLEDLSSALGDKLSDPLNKIAAASNRPDSVKNQEKIVAKLAEDFKRAMVGKDKTSLKSTLISAVGNLGSTLATTIGMQELHPEPVIKIIADQQGGPQPMSQTTVDTPPENPTT